jgi:hypothetical protein
MKNAYNSHRAVLNEIIKQVENSHYLLHLQR